ncbi:histidine kinase [Clostridium autoethanogenum]|uniref:histidine kinase n=1 Tax=Clostridium autoethanogenum TaxID=84023 RepID=A0A3M0SW69_9CLOT|nr:histidine kinase N-terminal domain-containing protein [Clostridium autoethanogenum]RMD02082.1 histidine kinase [Clostridium autoethanogenum]
MNTILSLCKMYTNLSETDIKKIREVSKILPTISDLVQADVFIDCPTKDLNKAIVVSEAKPVNCQSMYKNSVIGKLALRENEPAALRTLELGISTKDMKAVTQENENVSQTVAPIRNRNNNVIGVIIVEKDITEDINKSKYMKMLAETTEELTNNLLSLTGNEGTITNYLDDAIIIFDEHGVVEFTNSVADRLYKDLGYKDNIVGMHFNNVCLDDNSFKNVMSKKQFSISEVNISNYTLQVKYVFENLRSVGIVMMIKDITKFKQQEKELMLKSVAFKEIHHRVKNNLQMIASLLNLQARRIENEQTKIALKQSMNRILSIAATHEILSQNGMDDVDIKEVIGKVVEKIKMYSCSLSKKIYIDVSGNNFKVNSDKATSISLVVNELIENSIEHAFEEKEEGSIHIKIDNGKMYSSISVIDDGIGFDIDNVDRKSLGLNIVKSIVKEKLLGDLNMSSNNKGTRVVFDFKNSEN